MNRRAAALLALLLLAGTARAAVPPPSREELALGRRLAAQLESRYKVVTDPALTERLNRIAHTIVAVSDRAGVPYVFRVLDVDVANAVSLPGGFVYVTKPMFGYVRSDHELAALLAHEIAHVAHAHGMEMQRRQTSAFLITVLVAALTRDPRAARGVQLAGIGVLAHFTRDLERDADLTAIGYLQKTPYSPVAMLTLMERFEREEQYRATVDAGAWADHPRTAERVDYIEAELQRRGIPVIRRIPANYLRLTVREVKERPGGELLVNDRPVMRLPDPGRVREAAERLDRLFNADLRSFEVGLESYANTWSLVARGVTIVSFTARDAQWSGTTLKDLAISVHARLRAVMEEDLRRRKLTG
jgi:Zn-dependent protease with chaperone function